MRYRVAADIGGTFTDFVFQDAEKGVTFTGKSFSVPGNPAEAVIDGFRSYLPDDAGVDFFIHGTTVGLNAVLERRGARVALLTTKKFGDVYAIQGNDRRDIFSIHYRKPRGLIERRDVFVVSERLRASGVIETPIELRDLDPLIAAVRDGQYDAVAVCLLHAYRNPVHEVAVGIHLAKVLPNCLVSLSHQVSQEWREYARTSTTVMEAYIAPVVRGYLVRLVGGLSSVVAGRHIHIMQSNGGAMTATAAQQRPIETLLSGPVGGVIGAVAVSRALKRPNLICVDMGGTSFDASVVVASQLTLSSETELEGLPIQMSSADIHVIGAGGGSIAWLDGGHIRVGPKSAGAVPGPACYGRGGTEATVTDANAFLGRISSTNFVGGRMNIEISLAEKAIARIARTIRLSTRAMAQGIIDIVNARMADALRTITVRRGIDPREFSLLAYGGAGPMHAVALAEDLEIGEVIVPVHAGAFSAWGMLQADIKYEAKRTFFGLWSGIDCNSLESAFRELEAAVREHLSGEGVPTRDISLFRSADLRYEGQEYQINCPMNRRRANKALVRLAFDEAYVARYGHASPDASMEIVTIRTMGVGNIDRPAPIYKAPSHSRGGRTARCRRMVEFGKKGMSTGIITRGDMRHGTLIRGPVIIEEPTSTTVIPPGWTVVLCNAGHLMIRRG